MQQHISTVKSQMKTQQSQIAGTFIKFTFTSRTIYLHKTVSELNTKCGNAPTTDEG